MLISSVIYEGALEFFHQHVMFDIEAVLGFLQHLRWTSGTLAQLMQAFYLFHTMHGCGGAES